MAALFIRCGCGNLSHDRIFISVFILFSEFYVFFIQNLVYFQKGGIAAKINVLNIFPRDVAHVSTFPASKEKFDLYGFLVMKKRKTFGGVEAEYYFDT